MIFILLNEGSFNLNNQFLFFSFLLTMKIQSKGNMKRNYVQKPRYP